MAGAARERLARKRQHQLRLAIARDACDAEDLAGMRLKAIVLEVVAEGNIARGREPLDLEARPRPASVPWALHMPSWVPIIISAMRRCVSRADRIRRPRGRPAGSSRSRIKL